MSCTLITVTSKSSKKDETSLQRIQQALFSGSRHGFHAAVIPLVLSFGTSNRSGTRPSTADPPAVQMLQMIRALPLPAVLCLLFILLFILCDEYTVLHCSSPVPQDSRHSNFVAVLQNHIAETLFPSSFPCTQLKLVSAPLLFKSGQRSIWPLTKQTSLHVMEIFTTPTSR